MTINEITRLYSEWVRETVTYYPPLPQDNWVENIRDERRDMIDRPDFGFAMGLRMAGQCRISTLVNKPAYKWVRKTIEGIDSRWRFSDNDPDLLAIREVSISKQFSGYKPLLWMTLIARDATVVSVAAALNIPPLVVEAYEALFFNVLERKDDAAYLRRLVEAKLSNPGYEQDPETIESNHKLFHAGLNSSLDDVLLVLTSYGWEPVDWIP